MTENYVIISCKQDRMSKYILAQQKKRRKTNKLKYVNIHNKDYVSSAKSFNRKFI